MPRKAPSFVVELLLGTTPADERKLAIRFEAARNLYNACLQEALRRLDLMRESKDWQRARAMPRHLGTDNNGDPIPNPERTALFKAVIARFLFHAGSLQKYAEAARDACWIGDHLGSHDTQTTSLRAFKAVQMYAFGKRGRPRFKGKNRLNSVEGKSNAVIRCKDGHVLWGGLVLPVKTDPRDRHGWQAQALQAPLKYCRIVRRRIRGRDHWRVQLVLAGLSPRKENRPVGEGIVGLDIGPSTIAAVGEEDATLETFCPTLDDMDREIRLIRRSMDRSRRATNPDNYNPNGTVRPGPKKWARSNRYRNLQNRLAELERRFAAERDRSHGELGNRFLDKGNIIKTEKLSYKSFQKNYGRSVQRRAPGKFVSTLKRKAVSAGASLIEFKTRTTRLSQFDHKSGEYKKKPLSQRWHVFEDGTRVQRDLYSGWLARFVQDDRLDASQLGDRWAGAEPLLDQAASCFKQSAIGLGFPLPSVPRRVRADRLVKAEGRHRKQGSKCPAAGIEAGLAVARGPNPRERTRKIAPKTARTPEL